MEKPVSRFERRQRQLAFHFQIGLVIVLLLLIGAFNLNLQFVPDLDLEARDNKPFEIPVGITTIHEKREPVPPRPALPVEVPDETVIETPVEVFDLAEMVLDFESFVFDNEPEESHQDEPALILAEEMPQIEGGLSALLQSITYPQIAKKAGVEGTVYVQFVVDKQGTVRDARIMKGIGAGCDEEALRALQSVTFTPGRQRGKPVAVRMSIPVKFKLK